MACAVAIFATSCTTTISVVSKSALENTVAEVGNQLFDNGYTMTGVSNETKNEVSVTGTSYSRFTGYGSAMQNNYWQYSKYMYSDSLNNSVSYSIKYQLKKDYNGKLYVQDLEMTNCEASKDYNAICGGNGIVKKNIAQTRNNPDMVATIPNPTGTILGVTGGTIGVGIIVLIIVCLL